ncbi:MAG: glycosyltransferase [Candidatus Omnitrophica bacterium]|nr:glycosyltransferase [Candidatus Omnitrophota bacterium]
MYAKIYRNCLFPFYETFLKKRQTLTYLQQLENNQWLSEEELKRLQWKKLKLLIRHAYENVPYYQDLFHKLNLYPEIIKTEEDFRRIPILTRDDIQENYDRLIARNFAKNQLICKTTSGSTGVPMKFCYDRATYEWHMAGASRSDRWAGWNYGEKELYVWGQPPFQRSRFQRLKEDVHHAILRRKIINTFSLSTQNLKEKIEEINRFKPKVIIGYTNSVYILARAVKQLDIPCHRPRGIIVSAEKLFPFQRAAIEEAFGTKVYDRYGCQEVMLIAMECEQHYGMHMNIDNLYIEVLKDQKPSAPGQVGDVVLTDLRNHAFPLIRYKNNDLATLSDRQCSCGRGFPLFERVEGRTIDTIVTEDGRYVSGEVFLYILDRFDWVHKFRVIQESTIFLSVYIERKGVQDIMDDVEVIKGEMREVFGETMQIDISFLDKIPFEKSGKNRLVSSKVRQQDNKACLSQEKEKNVHVLHVILSLEFGGAEKVVTNMIQQMNTDRFTFTICVLDRIGSLGVDLDDNVRVECVNRKPGIDMRVPFRLAKLLKQYNPDIVHLHNSTCFFYGVLACRLVGLKNVIVTQHGISQESRRITTALRLISGGIKQAVAVSDNIVEYLKNTYHIPRNKISLLINGIDETLFARDTQLKKEGRKALGLNAGHLVIGHIARLSKEKDQHTLLKAFEKVRQLEPRAKLVIVGDGSLRAELQSLTKLWGLQNDVIFTGVQKNIKLYLNTFDVFALSSIREGTSLTLLEAMATQLPIVATSVGGTPNVVIDGETGILVPAGRPDKLADGLHRLISDPKMCQKMGKAARKRFDDIFTLTRMTRAYSDLYLSMLRS